MKQQKRKGFTLVELLVVIAILAVLATVSIVGYTSFINKARVANDTALIKQINDLLLADEAANGGKKPATMGEAMEIVGQGFNVANLTPTAQGYDFVYDMSANRFALLDKGKVVFSDGEITKDPTLLWTIVKDASIFDATYEAKNSLYIAKSVDNVSLSKLVGIDVAKDCTIANLTITDTETPTSEKPVVIAGNIGTATITAPNGEIAHYNNITTLNITEIKGKSWHEFGTVETVKLTKGHVVLENNSHIEYLQIVDDAQATVTIASATNGSKGTIGYVLRPESSSFTVENGDGIQYISGECHTNVKPEDLSGTISSGVYQLGENVNVTSSLTVGEGKTVIMQLSDSTTISNTINNNGELVVIGGSVASSDPDKAAIVNAEGATITLRGGTYTKNTEPDKDFYVIQNQGTMILEDVTIVAEGTNASCITNGWNDKQSDDKMAELTILSGTFSGGMNALKNDYNGKVTINGGTFQNSAGNTVMNWGEMVINGGEFSFQQSADLLDAMHATLANYAQATINGGTFTMHATASKTYTILNGSLYYGSTYFANGQPTLTINNGTFSVSGTTEPLLFVPIATSNIFPITNINGGEFVNESGYKIFARDGNSGGAQASNILVSGGKFTVKNDRNKNMDTTFIQMADGKYLCAENSLKEIEVSNTMPDETYKLKDKVYVSRNVWAVAYLKDKDGNITYYETLSGKDSAAKTVNKSKGENAGTLVILKDIIDMKPVCLFSKSLTLDLNGHKIKSKDVNAIQTDSNLTIIDSSEDKSGEITTNDSKYCAIYATQGSKVTLEDGKYTGKIKCGYGAEIIIGTGCSFSTDGTDIEITYISTTSYGKLTIQKTGVSYEATSKKIKLTIKVENGNYVVVEKK